MNAKEGTLVETVELVSMPGEEALVHSDSYRREER